MMCFRRLYIMDPLIFIIMKKWENKISPQLSLGLNYLVMIFFFTFIHYDMIFGLGIHCIYFSQ